MIYSHGELVLLKISFQWLFVYILLILIGYLIAFDFYQSGDPGVKTEKLSWYLFFVVFFILHVVIQKNLFSNNGAAKIAPGILLQ